MFDDPEVLVVAVLLMVALVIVILNDWTKRIAVAKAKDRNQTPKRSYLNNKTSWQFVLVFCVLAAGFLYLHANNDWVDDYQGPFEHVIRWMFADRR